MNRKDGSKNHYWESIEEAYYLVEVMVFVSVFPRRRFRVMAQMMMSSMMSRNVFFGGVS
jgi:hypothetical protein